MLRCFSVLYVCCPAKDLIGALTWTNRRSGGRTCDGAAAFGLNSAPGLPINYCSGPPPPLPFRQIRDRACHIGIVDHPEMPLASGLPGLCERRIFGILGKRARRIRRGKLDQRDQGGVRRRALERVDIGAARQVTPTMLCG